jgi:hypothetical protein
MKWILWKFDMIIYKLFYWRWNRRLIEDDNLRKLFLSYFKSWETIRREPAMGIGTPPKFPKPEL